MDRLLWFNRRSYETTKLRNGTDYISLGDMCRDLQMIRLFVASQIRCFLSIGFLSWYPYLLFSPHPFLSLARPLVPVVASGFQGYSDAV